MPVGQPTPKCAPPAQWTEWVRANYNPMAGRPVHPCTDCTPEFQAEQSRLKRCENPHATFSRDADGFLQIDLSTTTATTAQEKP